MIQLPKNSEVWFLVGSQHLYGEAGLKKVAANAQVIARSLNRSEALPLHVSLKPVLTRPDEITQVMDAANTDPKCVGVVAWMHTFSPAKMWINGLKILRKPLAHLHTQFNRELPWGEIDMDFMNLNQAAHGDREFGFIGARLRLDRKIIVGHWEDADVLRALAAWMRAARAWHDWQGAKFARFGDNMRQVAVTEGNKVSAEIAFGFSVNGYGVGDLAAKVNAVKDTAVNRLCAKYLEEYKVAAELRPNGARHEALRDAARLELGLRAFLEEGGFKGFTTTFEDLHGLAQLPGIAAQRLMADGYGFSAEGDWKTAALVRAFKVMADGLPGGVSFMEDYTYHLAPEGRKVLGAHMLEICPSIAAGQPRVEIHPLSIGGKADPVRLVFDTPPGAAVNASLVDLGNRFRLLMNEVTVVAPDSPLPKLPVARAVWEPKPDFATAAAAWILAGGAHHTAFSPALTKEHVENFAEMAGVEYFLIAEHTTMCNAKRELRWNELYYHLAPGLGSV
jgi:L-arabinose isomerase